VTAARLRVTAIDCFEWPFALRLPFRFGSVTVTHGRQAVARVRIRLADGREADGMAAESLAAKWFDKTPTLSDEQNVVQLRRAVELARDAALAHGEDTAFGHFAAAYAPLMQAGAAAGLPPLVIGYGPALLDRAIADALGRALGVSIFELVRGNILGIAPAAVAPDLAGFDADAFLAGLTPRTRLHMRHTVGMLDPLTAADRADRIDDGLPETLQEVIAAYGNRYFKLKLGGAIAADLDRLCRIAAVLDAIGEPYRVTLDGNEQFADTAGVLALLRAIAAEPRLDRLRRALLFIEQPIRRADALCCDVGALDAFAPVILDESDGTMEAFGAGRRAGYRGISSKTCKGFYKSLINRMRCAHWNAAAGTDRFFMSGEDLTTLAGLAVQQDLAVAAVLGLAHVERNGHHFVDGFCSRPEAESFLAAHPDLYRRTEGGVRLRIKDGRIGIASLACPGFAAAAWPDVASMDAMPAAQPPPAHAGASAASSPPPIGTHAGRPGRNASAASASASTSSATAHTKVMR
jgi:hypothetical protein